MVLKQEQMTSQVTPEALILKVSAWVRCHASHHLTLWTVTKASPPPPHTFICQREIINTIISPMLALYSVNCFRVWLCLFIFPAWISERPLIRLFHYTLALCTTRQSGGLPACRAQGSDVRFIKAKKDVLTRHSANMIHNLFDKLF